jgi:hypothetical protein
MTITFAALLFAPLFCTKAHAIDLADAIKDAPAQIEVANMQAVPLVVSADKKGWSSVPTGFTSHGAAIYMPTGDTNGVADIKVTADGILLLACNYDYQGNSAGNWKEDMWDERKFKTKGWHVASKNELGGDLISGENRTQIVFIRQVRKGDALRLRCNKYNPPYPILLTKK